MANNWYDAGRKYALDGNLVPSSNTIKACLLKDTYVPDLAAHIHLNDLGTNRVGTDQTLGSITTTAGVLGAATATFPTVAGGSLAKYIALYRLIGDGTPADVTSPLLMLFDTILGFPVATSGANILIAWNVSGIGAPAGSVFRV